MTAGDGCVAGGVVGCGVGVAWLAAEAASVIAATGPASVSTSVAVCEVHPPVVCQSREDRHAENLRQDRTSKDLELAHAVYRHATPSPCNQNL